MGKFIIKGGKPLTGEIELMGAKNAATKMMLASLLTDKPCHLDNFPSIGDTEITAELCREIGSNLEVKGKTLKIQTPEVKSNKVLQLSRRNRIPILALGPLLARTGEAEVPILGGDRIGPRPVELHIKGLTAMGAEIEIGETNYRARAPHGLHGADITLDFPSVGATENIILAAVLASGQTVIRNAALEPELMGIVKMLQKMGAIIELGAHRDIHVEGVARLRGVRHKILPDRNEAVSYACLAIATGGKVLVKDAIQDHLITFLNTVRRLKAEYEVVREGIIFSRNGNKLQPLMIETAPHPGFMTDWQQPLSLLLMQAEGESLIHETIYEDRFGYLKDLRNLGADVEIGTECPPGRECRFLGKEREHVAKIKGGKPLYGGKLAVRDLRAGIVAVIAALTAGGESEIEGIDEIDRGYENIDERLRKLGADIVRA